MRSAAITACPRRFGCSLEPGMFSKTVCRASRKRGLFRRRSPGGSDDLLPHDSTQDGSSVLLCESLNDVARGVLAKKRHHFADGFTKPEEHVFIRGNGSNSAPASLANFFTSDRRTPSDRVAGFLFPNEAAPMVIIPTGTGGMHARLQYSSCATACRRTYNKLLP